MEENDIKNDNELPENSSQEEQEDSPKEYRNGTADTFKGLGLGILFEVIVFYYMLQFSVSLWLPILLYIGLIIFLFIIKKTRFALGLILALSIPIAIFGGCLLIFSR